MSTLNQKEENHHGKALRYNTVKDLKNLFRSYFYGYLKVTL